QLDKRWDGTRKRIVRMSFSRMRVSWVLPIVLGIVSRVGAQAPAPSSGDVVLAEKFGEMAQSSLRVKQITKSAWAESAALYREAMRLNPTEPRYPRLLVDLMLTTHDEQGAIEALTVYRKLRPNDQVPQIQA